MGHRFSELKLPGLTPEHDCGGSWATSSLLCVVPSGAAQKRFFSAKSRQNSRKNQAEAQLTLTHLLEMTVFLI